MLTPPVSECESTREIHMIRYDAVNT